MSITLLPPREGEAPVWYSVEEREPSIPFVYIDDLNNRPMFCISVASFVENGKTIYQNLTTTEFFDKMDGKPVWGNRITYWMPIDVPEEIKAANAKIIAAKEATMGGLGRRKKK